MGGAALMARVAVSRTVVPVEGVYEAVRVKVAEGLRVNPDHVGRRRCLEAMSAGEPVRVIDSLLPDDVKSSAAYAAAKRGVGRSGNQFVRTAVIAIVYPDGRVSYDAQSAADWMAECMPEDLIDWRYL